MKATEAKFLDFLKASPQFVIPIYQRTYSWTEKECLQLWDDILRAGRDDAVSAHFVGSIVYIEGGLYQVSSHAPLLVIDGQQRLTTLCLMLEALARAVGDDEPVDGFSTNKIRGYYLVNQLEKGDRHFKLLLTQTDKAGLIQLVQQKAKPSEPSLRIEENFSFFERRLQALGSEIDIVCKGLAKLVIVDVALSRDQDNPQLIFESMNSTGRELSQADLIRNFVLMGLAPDHQTSLYDDYWRPMELAFGQEAYGLHFDAFMRHYLTVKTGEIPNIGRVYEAFKLHARGLNHDELVADINHYSAYYCAFALGQETDPVLSDAFQDLRELKVDVSYPLLLDLYQEFATGSLEKGDLVAIVRLIEAYVFRRAVCDIPTNTLNKTFATFKRALGTGSRIEAAKAHLLSLGSYRRFPNNEEFKRELKVRDLYNFRSRTYWLRRLENHNRKERVVVNEYTIEHIMPQSTNLSAKWRDDLGPEWRRVQETKLHTLGNLTLTAYNSEMSDRPFVAKRDIEGGFAQSPLKLNQGLGQLDKWDESEIDLRAGRLADLALHVWSAPSLSDEILEAYRPTAPEFSGYTIHDHPYLAPELPMRKVFDALRKEILAIDPTVTEEFLKLYVAYKAETNFVDIVPQAKRLRLSLNMPFHELNDPSSLARDVSNLGRWGNGDVEIGIDSVEQILYVTGLVRQSFERQLGSD